MHGQDAISCKKMSPAHSEGHRAATISPVTRHRERPRHMPPLYYTHNPPDIPA